MHDAALYPGAGPYGARRLREPVDPSDTTSIGAGVLIISAAQELEHSLCARCHAITCSLERATSTTASWENQMPSRKTVSKTSPVKGAMGQSSQNPAHFRQKVDLLYPRSAIDLLERIQARKARSSLAALSILLVLEAPHDLHRQRLVPAFVYPFPFISLPQTSHLGLLKASSCPLGNFSLRKACLNRHVKRKADTLLKHLRVGRFQLKDLICLCSTGVTGLIRTHFLKHSPRLHILYSLLRIKRYTLLTP